MIPPPRTSRAHSRAAEYGCQGARWSWCGFCGTVLINIHLLLVAANRVAAMTRLGWRRLGQFGTGSKADLDSWGPGIQLSIACGFLLFIGIILLQVLHIGAKREFMLTTQAAAPV